MDASNPVMSSDRHTIESILERKQSVRRQDLGYLAEVARTTQRTQLPVNATIPIHEVKAIVEEFSKTQVVVETSKAGTLNPKVFKEVGEIPICGIIDEDHVPLHPPSINNKLGKVCVNRTMGGQPKSPLGLVDIVEVLGDDVLETKNVYTGGTWKGFLNRLDQQMGRKTVPIAKTMGEAKPLKRRALFQLLDQYMPRERNEDWVGMGGDFYEDLTTKLQITMNASAGAPYWRNKGECLEQIVETGLPIVIDAIKHDKLENLMRTNPEMFLVEVKNKLDRYEKSKLEEKTRPYVCVPAHWSFLFSMLTQGFQETLSVFTQDPTSSNAYGFSSSKGGLKKMVEWMYTADKRGKVVCYGDDACIVVKIGNTIYRIDPDFKQMDGSLDSDDIALTVEWILEHLARDKGETGNFWHAVGEVWKIMACNPLFMVDGIQAYRKVNPNGLMTGVPGTTLFDTVKSVLAWNKLLDVCRRGDGNILDEQFVTGWMAKQGLVVKPGTWNPTPLPDRINPGELVTDHKFLGVQILCVSWKGTIQFVPTIPYEDAVEMLVVQKDNPYDKKTSRTTMARTLYDRMRGLMITMGFSHPRIQEAIHNVVNHLPPEVILMQTQDPTGAKPEHITLQDFNYPDSSGFPSYDFCVSVYADQGEGDFIQLFPDLTEKLKEFKLVRKDLNKKYKMLLTPDPYNSRVVASLEASQVTPIPKPYELVEAMKPVKPPKGEVINKRSYIFQYKDGEAIEGKRLPTLGRAIKDFLTTIGGITQMSTLCEKFGVTPHHIEREAYEYGFYIDGSGDWNLVSLYPMATPFPSVQEKLLASWEENTAVNKGASDRLKARKVKDLIVETAPEILELNTDLLSNLKVSVPVVENDEKALVLLNKMLAQSGYNMLWTSMVDPARPNPVGVLLKIRGATAQDLPETFTTVAEAWSLSRVLAQGYVARAIMDLNYVEVVHSKYTTRFLPPPDPYAFIWSDDVEYTHNPLRNPIIADSGGPGSTVRAELFHKVSKELPFVPSRFVDIAYSIVTTHPGPPKMPEVVRGEMLALLKRLDPIHKWSGGSPEPEERSKRSRLPADKKRKLNRKLLERRKRRLVSSQNP